jgi:hypothetical protein
LSADVSRETLQDNEPIRAHVSRHNERVASDRQADINLSRTVPTAAGHQLMQGRIRRERFGRCGHQEMRAVACTPVRRSASSLPQAAVMSTVI